MPSLARALASRRVELRIYGTGVGWGEVRWSWGDLRMWAGAEASREEEQKILAPALLAAVKASATRTRMARGRRGPGEEPFKKHLSDLSSSPVPLFICLATRIPF